MSTTKGSERWAPFPGTGAERVRVLGAPNRGCIRVRWTSGPLKGREARIPADGLRQHRRDIEDEDIRDLL